MGEHGRNRTFNLLIKIQRMKYRWKPILKSLAYQYLELIAFRIARAILHDYAEAEDGSGFILVKTSCGCQRSPWSNG